MREKKRKWIRGKKADSRERETQQKNISISSFFFSSFSSRFFFFFFFAISSRILVRQLWRAWPGQSVMQMHSMSACRSSSRTPCAARSAPLRGPQPVGKPAPPRPPNHGRSSATAGPPARANRAQSTSRPPATPPRRRARPCAAQPHVPRLRGNLEMCVLDNPEDRTAFSGFRKILAEGRGFEWPPRPAGAAGGGLAAGARLIAVEGELGCDSSALRRPKRAILLRDNVLSS